MSDENNKLVTTGKLGPTKVGLGKALATAKQSGSMAEDTVVNFQGYPNRIVICIDDSGSMSASMNIADNKQQSRMEIAKQACEGFIQVCNPGDTVLGLYAISTDKQYPLNWDYVPLLTTIKELGPSGGTPTFGTLEKVQDKENVTRVVLISDGASNEGFAFPELDGENEIYANNRSKLILDKYLQKKVSIDTVFIGTTEDTTGIQEMKDIAQYTGGLFIHFKDAKDFASKFKYLAPAFYGLLVSGEIKL